MRWLVLVVLSGCSIFTPHVDTTRYFVLTSADAPASGNAIKSVVGIGRVELPEYLVRDEMVTRSASNQINVADYDRWGEPLRDGFARALRGDLERDLGEGHVIAQPFDPGHMPAWLLDVDVRRLEHVAGQGAMVDVRWTLRERSNDAVLATKDSHQIVPSPDKDTGAAVAALSKAVAALAADIGAAVRAQP